MSASASVPTTAATTTDHKVSTYSWPAPAVTQAGRVAIVTGGSRGIGAGVALRLARDGAKVVVNYHSDEKSANLVVSTIVANGGTAMAIKADIGSSKDVDRLFDDTKRAYGRIDIVVANAGVIGFQTLGAATDEEIDRLFHVNLKGVLYCLRAASNHVENNGRIITIGSRAKLGIVPGLGVYAAAKVAIEVLASTLAQELGSKNITVNTVHPGYTATDMSSSASDEVMRAAAATSPFKRIATVADVADIIVWVASESSRWLSGQAIMATGAAK